MAMLTVHYRSAALERGVGFSAILPEPIEAAGVAPPYRTLWLLHGLSDDHTAWVRRTGIERHAEAHGLAVVMPDAGRSFYADMVEGERYWTFISEELPAAARRMLPLSGRREDNFVAGLSMGGYGAFKLALARPGGYAAGMSLSGALAALDRPVNGNGVSDALRRAVGEPGEARGTIADLDHLAQVVVESGGPAPRLWACCGTADLLYEENLAFRDRAAAAGLTIDWRFDEGEAHEWGYWDRSIVRAMDWMLAG